MLLAILIAIEHSEVIENFPDIDRFVLVHLVRNHITVTFGREELLQFSEMLLEVFEALEINLLACIQPSSHLGDLIGVNTHDGLNEYRRRPPILWGGLLRF